MRNERQKRNRRIQQQAKIDARQYRAMSAKRRIERLRAAIEEGRALVIGWLARGELSPADIPPGAIA